LLPPFENIFNPGNAIAVLPRPNETLGVAICKDMDFTGLSRQYGKAGIGLLLDPGWDFNIDRGWHGHIAIMRGVESGFSIARSAKQGILTITDDRGRVLAQRTTGSAGFDTVVADVPVANERTFYVRAGDWFFWFDMALLAIIFLSPALRTLRTSRPKQEAA
jgi:apolipoprotein N-acyltransferase